MFLRNKLRELDEEPMREQLIPEAMSMKTATMAVLILSGVYMYANREVSFADHVHLLDMVHYILIC